MEQNLCVRLPCCKVFMAQGRYKSQGGEKQRVGQVRHLVCDLGDLGRLGTSRIGDWEGYNHGQNSKQGSCKRQGKVYIPLAYSYSQSKV